MQREREMATVNIMPMPQWCRKISAKFRQMPPPIFPDGPPSEEDMELARELFRALDSESQDWYRRGRARRTFDGL